MKTYIPYSLLAAIAATGLAVGAETAYTTPVGYVTVNCLPASDTFVGLPLRQPTVAAAALSSAPSVGATNAVLTVSGATFGSYANTHYVKFTSGTNAGGIYAITANDATTVTIDRAGETLTVANGDKFQISKFWTLGELFPIASSTTDVNTTGTAIVVSTGAGTGVRRTEVLLADTRGTQGINLSSVGTFYITGGQWRKQGESGDFSGQQIWPDAPFSIRNPVAVTAATKYTVAGEVETANTVIPLATRAGTALQDNPIGVTRPVDVTLSGLNLANTPAFVSSAGAGTGARRDELLVYNNAVASINRSASVTYYYNSTLGQWRAQGGSVDAGSTIIPAGSAFTIRKYGTTGAVTAFWNNTSTY